jgi:hypothetical protein
VKLLSVQLAAEAEPTAPIIVNPMIANAKTAKRILLIVWKLGRKLIVLKKMERKHICFLLFFELKGSSD